MPQSGSVGSQLETQYYHQVTLTRITRGHQGQQGSLRVTGEITMIIIKCDKWLDIGLSQDPPSGLKARGLDVVKIGRRPMLLLQTCLM